ncbi:putative transcription factor interactor and regulator LIM family [Lupinus albus]|uniref:Putative transcription factor interactor and regulator LIM family n=1 Tax=Lupinus albus TaxID=3870 RepID=A0A6A4NP43_LUPAL|nr:putative transcription factor interactor and regulator LIM family [Lupinus albus]
MSFIGTQQKCKACEKTVYPVDQLSADGTAYHKACFRCSHCKGTLKVTLFFVFEIYLYFFV